MFMASNATYQQICPELTRKPWSVLSPDDEGRGPHTCNTSGISFHRATNILVLSSEKTCIICYITFFKKNIKNTFNSLKAGVFMTCHTSSYLTKECKMCCYMSICAFKSRWLIYRTDARECDMTVLEGQFNFFVQYNCFVGRFTISGVIKQF